MAVEPPREKHRSSFVQIPITKIIYRYLVKNFIPPFILTFFLCLLIILMQFLWKYVDDLVGKGLEWYLILKLLFYASATFFSLALPLAVLLSSLMTFGNLGEKYEIVAMKSAGISVTSLMRPLAFLSLLIGLFSFWFSNSVLPIANVKMKTLLYEIREQKPALSITEGVFYDGFGDYTIRVGKKHLDNENVEDVIIYDHSRRMGNVTMTYAKRGTMTMTPDKHYFLFTLYDGFYWDESRSQNGRRDTHPLFFMKFDKQYMKFDLSSFEMQKADESFFKSSQQSMTIQELSAEIDTIQQERSKRLQRVSLRFCEQMYFFYTQLLRDSLYKSLSLSEPKITFDSLPLPLQHQVLDYASQRSTEIAQTSQSAFDIVDIDDILLFAYQVEWHRKFTLALACFLFFFIGAPLGTIIRKGGIGVPLVITVVFFAFYFVISIIGEKMAKSGEIAPWVGMWLSTFIIFPICVFLTYKATMDSAILSPDTYLNIAKKIKSFFNRKTKQNTDNPA